MRIRTSLTRVAALALATFISLTCVGGCSRRDETVVLTAFTITANPSFDSFFTAYSENHPDVAFEKSAYYGCAASAYMLRRFQMNDLTDIVIMTYAPSDELQRENLLDLSGYDFMRNFKISTLNNLDVDGKIYLLEGPSSVRGIAYNKTLFSENGWKAPESHEEFMALIRQIRRESSIMPLAIPGKYQGTYFTIMSELSHCDFLQTPQGASWANDFAKGEASSETGFGSGISLLKDWLDAGAFEASQIENGDSADYEMLANRECAMSYVVGSQSRLVELTRASQDSFGMFPLYGRGEDSEFCATTYGVKLGINKRLAEKGNEKKLEKALKLMEYFSTEEGQMFFYSGLSDILPLAGESPDLPEIFTTMNEVLNRGHSAPFLYSGYEDVLADAGEYIRDVCTNGGDLEGVFELIDTRRADTLKNVEDTYRAIVTETLDERQTAQFVANALNAQGLGDFAMVSMCEYTGHFTVAGGSNGKIYAGGITIGDVDIPLSGYNLQSIMTARLTGGRVRELITDGRTLLDDEGHEDSYEYFASGLDIERSADGAIASVSVNGQPLRDDDVYTVVFAPQDYTDDIAQIAQDTGIVWKDAYREYVFGLGAITPEHAA
ncbi:MAG: extracellular solute-binding protein [Clostridia bacterium]|nr:extracellular solute-binding protein [Clostridia bacterium]